MMTANRTPYDAEHVAIVDNGHTVTALYIRDPELARNPRAALDRILDRTVEIEIVATARRFYKRDGAVFSGWIVDCGPQDHSDPIPNKRDALRQLRRDIAEYFNR